MLCSICDRKVRDGHRVFIIRVAKAESGDGIDMSNVGFVPASFEDTTREKVWHYTCAAQFIPLSLLGIVRSDEMPDV